MAKSDQGPCWSGYEMIGMKEKNGKEVPNCVKTGKASSAKKKSRAQKAKSK